MGNYSDQPMVKAYRNGFYRQDPNMMPYEFKKIYDNIPVYLPSGGKMTFGIKNYMSKYSEERKKQALALRKKIVSSYGDSLDKDMANWLYSKRLAACFAGHGLPEELSLIATYAVYCGYKSEGEMASWAPSVFGLDCNGFANAYFTAIGTFKKPLYYIPSYTQHAGLTKKANEVTYDGVVCFARIKGSDGKEDKYSRSADWQVRPNPGNGSHIMIVDCWSEKWSSLWITQMSATYGLDTHQYDVLESPDTRWNSHAIWQVRRREHARKPGKRINVMISKKMPAYIGKDGEV